MITDLLATCCLCDACLLRVLEGCAVLTETGRAVLASAALRSVCDQLGANPGLHRGCSSTGSKQRRSKSLLAYEGRA